MASSSGEDGHGTGQQADAHADGRPVSTATTENLSSRANSPTMPVQVIPVASSPAAPTIRPAGPVRLRRLPSSPLLQGGEAQGGESSTGRLRSTSSPLQVPANVLSPTHLRPPSGADQHLETVREHLHVPSPSQNLTVPQLPVSRIRSVSNAARNRLSGGRPQPSPDVLPVTPQQLEYESEVVDLLDVIDPEVSTLTTLNNVQNSLFIPYLGRYINRQPTYDLSRHVGPPPKADIRITPPTDVEPPATATEPARPGGKDEEIEPAEEVEEWPGDDADLDHVAEETLTQLHTIRSQMTGSQFAVLPHGATLPGWSDEDKAELNDYVRHLLHSRRAAFKRSMRGFGKFVQKPVGFFVTLYAFLLTFWGTAWVLFLIGWLHAGNRQAYFVEICDQILTALFAVVGLGMAPFRAVDTYHMIYIAHYHYLTWRLRQERDMPNLSDPNDLPEPDPANADIDIEHRASEKMDEEPVLSEEQQRKLLHHQTKFTRSHTFYKPHETLTHHAFSVKLLITVVVLLDCHSMFQAALGGTTWGIYYRRRPKALTAVILTCSILCNISGGLTISIGDKRSRKKEVVERMFRQALTKEAMVKISKRRGTKLDLPLDEEEKKKRDKENHEHKHHPHLHHHKDKASVDVIQNGVKPD